MHVGREGPRAQKPDFTMLLLLDTPSLEFSGSSLLCSMEEITFSVFTESGYKVVLFLALIEASLLTKEGHYKMRDNSTSACQELGRLSPDSLPHFSFHLLSQTQILQRRCS